MLGRRVLLVLAILLLASNIYASDTELKTICRWFGQFTDAQLRTCCENAHWVTTSSYKQGEKITGMCPDVILAKYFMSMTIDTTNKRHWTEIMDKEDWFEHSHGTVGQGTHTGDDDSATLVDSTKSWEVDIWAGGRVVNTVDKSHCEIISNTENSVTCQLTTGTDNDWDAGDAYSVDRMTKPVNNKRFLMDVGNTKWCDYIANISNNLPAHFNATYLDVARPTWYSWGWPEKPYDWVDHDTYTQEKSSCIDRIGQLTTITTIMNGMKNAMEAKGIGYLNNLEGAMSEPFIFKHDDNVFNKTIATQYLEYIITFRDAGKISLVLLKSRVDTRSRLTALASYMLVLYDDSYFGMENGGPSTYPEYKIDLGVPMEDFNSVSESLEQVHFWVRDYEIGKAVVNPEPDDHDFVFNGSYAKAVVSGGGLIAEDGSTDGILTWESVSSPLTIEAESGVILMNTCGDGNCSAYEDYKVCPDDCYHPADTDEDGCIVMDELIPYINCWKSTLAQIPGCTLVGVIDALDMWKIGC